MYLLPDFLLCYFLVHEQMVYAEGSPEADAYTNKKNQAAATLHMRVSNLQLFGSNKENQPGVSTTNSNAGNNMVNNYQPSPSTAIQNPVTVVEDDLPF